MPNSIKYNVSTETLALKKGNFWIGTGDVGKGPTSTSGFYNGITPSSGGYTIYLNKSSGGPSIYVAYDNTELISITNKIAGTSYSTVNECLNYYASQTDKVITNKECPAIITNGLVLNIDASFTPSYPKNGTTWYDISGGGNNSSLVNGPTYSSNNGGYIVFDGIDDYVSIPDINFTTATIDIWVYINAYSAGGAVFVYQSSSGFEIWSGTDNVIRYNKNPNTGLTSGPGFTLNSWNNIVATSDGTVNRLYLNNVNIGSTNGGIFDNTSGDIRISGYGGYMVNGRCSTLKMYNRALSVSELTQNYNATAFLGSQYNPANSAAAILSANPSATDGYYWINTSLGPRQLYCIMSQGGWMGVTSELSPQIANLGSSASWETNTNRRLQSTNSQVLNVTVQEGDCGSPKYYQLRSPSVNGLNHSQTMLLIQRISTIGQCSYITDTVSNGYYTGPEYTGTYTSSAMCTWGDGNFANTCCGAQNMTGLKTYWVLIGSGTNSSLTYQVQCAGGSGQHYHMWFVK